MSSSGSSRKKMSSSRSSRKKMSSSGSSRNKMSWSRSSRKKMSSSGSSRKKMWSSRSSRKKNWLMLPSLSIKIISKLNEHQSMSIVTKLQKKSLRNTKVRVSYQFCLVMVLCKKNISRKTWWWFRNFQTSH